MFQKGFIVLNKMNLGCGPDIKEGWTNVDRIMGDGIENWNMTAKAVPENWKEHFDFILVNHVLCLIPYGELVSVLEKIKTMLKPGGTVQIIDMDVRKAIDDYIYNGGKSLPIQEGSSEWNLCMHLSGYSTRPSLFTPHVLYRFLESAGFETLNIWNTETSEHDLRPLESLVVEATK